MFYSKLTKNQRKEIDLSEDTALIIEDQEAYRDVLKIILDKELKLNVVETTNPKEAFEYLKDAKALPSVILLDMQMPVMDGKTALMYIRNNKLYKDIPVIAFTAMSNEILVRELARLGISGYIVKPGTKELIAQKVYDAIKCAKMKNNPEES